MPGFYLETKSKSHEGAFKTKGMWHEKGEWLGGVQDQRSLNAVYYYTH